MHPVSRAINHNLRSSADSATGLYYIYPMLTTGASTSTAFPIISGIGVNGCEGWCGWARPSGQVYADASETIRRETNEARTPISHIKSVELRYELGTNDWLMAIPH